MLDIETTGIDPAHSHIIQIAAVRFNLETKEIDVDNMFDMSLMMMSANRFWDEGTRAWWGRQKDGLLESILDRGQNPPHRRSAICPLGGDDAVGSPCETVGEAYLF